MFTRMSKVVLWIAGIAIFIAGAATMGMDAIGFYIWLGGFVLLWGIGTYVEMINNIMDIKKLLSKGVLYNVQDNNIQPTYQVPVENLSITHQNQGKWYCRKCGTENSSDDLKCIGCGTSYDNKISASNTGFVDTGYNLSLSGQQTENRIVAPPKVSNSGFNLSQIAQQTESQKQVAACWFCRACGEKNSSQQQYCSGCGKYR